MALSNDALTTVEAVCIRLGIEPVPESTTLEYKQLEALINEVSDFVQNSLLHRKLGLQSYIEYKEASGTPYLLVDQRPIVSITEIKSHEVLLVEDEDFVLYDFDKEAGMIYSSRGWRASYGARGLTEDPSPRLKSIYVSYTAGYILPGNEGRNLPYDIEGLVLTMVSSIYHKIETGSEGLRRLTEGTLTYEWSVATITDSQYQVINSYKSR